MNFENKCKEYQNWLQYIVDISFDRDGMRSAEDLGELVDELCLIARKALKQYKCPINCNNAIYDEEE